MEKQIPKWVIGYAGLMTLLPIGISVMLIMDPSKLFPNLVGVSGALALAGPFGFYISRNLAGGAVMGTALWHRSAPMLQLAFVMRLVTDVLDFVFMYALTGQWIPFLFVWIVMFWVPSALGYRSTAARRVKG